MSMTKYRIFFALCREMKTLKKCYIYSMLLNEKYGNSKKKPESLIIFSTVHQAM